MAKNADLGAAKTAKKDEFYTQLTDIEKEMRYYRKHFQGKTVLCNCDDPFESNFFKYFALNFNRLGLKKLIATCYYSSPIAGQQLQYGCDANGQMTFYFEDKGAEENKSKRPYKAVVTQVYDKMGDGGVDMLDVAELFRTGENGLVELEGDGDFRSPECLDLLDESDIVVTNPPFSLFREYVATLAEHQKHFIIIGNVNALKYKEIFPYIISNQIWLGASIHSGDRAFFVPDDYSLDASTCGIDEATGRKYIRVKGVRWYTNLDMKQRHEELILVKRYSPENNPSYDNYNAVEVSKTADIPCDYTGIMGVPITFFDKFNPDQFEIIWQASGNTRASAPVEILEQLGYKPSKEDRGGCCLLNGKRTYDRVFIRNKHPEPPKEVK